MLAYFDCFSGLAGDMALAALLEVGLPLDRLREELAGLALSGYRLESRSLQQAGVRGRRLEVVLEPAGGERRLGELIDIVGRSRLAELIVARATDVLQRLGRATAAVSGEVAADPAFSARDAVELLVDVVGTVAGLQALGVERVFASALPVSAGGPGRGGPTPSPLVLALLAEAGAPLRPVEGTAELITPTGAALLVELATFEQPPMRLRAVGYGIGARQLLGPSCLRIWLGEAVEPNLGRDEVTVLEANLDDTTPEALGYAMERLFAAGALDVYFQQLQMKKNRPGVLLGVICQPARTNDMAALMLAETTTLGVRLSRRERVVAPRRMVTFETKFGPLLMKVKELSGRQVAAPEYEDAARLARERGVPLAEVYRAAAAVEVPNA
jgi:uncharacterized protein (TIGR00299 family) protein